MYWWMDLHVCFGLFGYLLVDSGYCLSLWRCCLCCYFSWLVLRSSCRLLHWICCFFAVELLLICVMRIFVGYVMIAGLLRLYSLVWVLNWTCLLVVFIRLWCLLTVGFNCILLIVLLVSMIGFCGFYYLVWAYLCLIVVCLVCGWCIVASLVYCLCYDFVGFVGVVDCFWLIRLFVSLGLGLAVVLCIGLWVGLLLGFG